MENTSIGRNFSPELIDSICCTVALEPFVRPQMVNCREYHTFSLNSARSLFGKMLNGECERKFPCPLCRENITAYHPNIALQSVVDSILGIKEGPVHYNKMFEMVRKHKMELNKGIAYPLERSHFRNNGVFFEKDGALLSLENKISREQCGFAIENVLLTVKAKESKFEFEATLFLNSEEEEHSPKLLEFFKKNRVLSFTEREVGISRFLFFSSSSASEFLLIVKLLMQFNEFEHCARSNLCTLLDWCRDFPKLLTSS